jgi:hypothetical protein
VSGEIGPTESNFGYWFQYSTDGVNWSSGPEAGSGSIPAKTSTTTQVSEDLKGLKGSTHYFVRLHVQDYGDPSQTEYNSPEPYPELTTLAVDPPTFVSANSATDVEYSIAKVSGEVERPSGNADPAFDVNCYFEYVSDQQFNESGFEFAGRADCAQNPVKTAGVKVSVSAKLNFLSPGTTYHLRLSAENAGGAISDDAPSTFTTLGPVPPPTVTIDPVTAITDTTAHFSGQINPGGNDPVLTLDWEFVCQPSCPNPPAEGFCVPKCTGAPGSRIEPPDASLHAVEFDPIELEPNTTYQVELRIFTFGGISTAGGPITFKTDAVKPQVETLSPFAIEGGTEALIGGKVNPRNSGDATYWIEYGPGEVGTSFTNALPASKDADAGSGGQFILDSRKITGLIPETKYHYRVVAENTIGKTLGDDIGFETPGPRKPIQGDCPNAKIRTETNSAALPECRAYEMTTEPEKIGGDVYEAVTTSPDGNRVGYTSPVAFGDSKANIFLSAYVGQRGTSGWTTRAMQPPFGAPGAANNAPYLTPDYSSDLSKTVSWPMRGTADEPRIANVVLQDIDGSTTWVTAPTVPGAKIDNKYYVGRSADASRIFFQSYQNFLPGLPNGVMQVWEWFDGQVRLVSRHEDGSPFTEDAVAGSGSNEVSEGALAETTLVSADGSRVFFGSANHLYVREDGQHTQMLSVSKRTDSVGQDAHARFAAAAVDGSIAYMNSGEQLTNDAPPKGGLYSYNLETDEMYFIGPKASVVLASQDGKRVYFTSPKLLIPGKGTAGAKNLYTANYEGGDAFVGTVEPGDLSLGLGGNSYVSATPDGSKFAFDSTAPLTAYDNAGHRAIYLYEADKGSLLCASCRPDGQPAEGDAGIQRAGLGGSIPNGRPRGISNDGSQVFFEAEEGLVPEDANGQRDVYEYRDGQVSLISPGTSPYPSQIIDNSPDGKNVFFTTRDSLVGQDIDGGNVDVYDARVEGGFPAPPPPVSLCEGEACQGQAHGAPAYTTPGTTSQGRGNPDFRKNSCARKSKKQHSKCGKKTKKHKSKKHNAKKASKSGRGE